EDQRAIRIGDPAGPRHEGKRGEGIASCGRVPTGNVHRKSLPYLAKKWLKTLFSRPLTISVCMFPAEGKGNSRVRSSGPGKRAEKTNPPVTTCLARLRTGRFPRHCR